jgi:CHAD domain-containing protein
MKPLCFVLDNTDHNQTPKAILSGDWRCERTHGTPLHFQRSYLDSLDWRLLRNGLSLVADYREGRIQLRLIGLGDNQTRLEADAGHMPVFVPSLPAGEWGAILAPILRQRALVPHIQLAVARHCMAVLDKQGKTVAHLELDLSELLSPDESEIHWFDRRLWFVPFKGYEKQNKAIVNILSEYGLPVSYTVVPVTGLIAALHIDTARFDARPNVEFHAEERCDGAVKRLLRFFLAVMETNRPFIVADIDTDCLHDFRVAVRRSRSLLGQMQGVIAKQRLIRARAFLSRLNEVTNHQRDLDVMLLNFNYYRSLLPARLRRNLDPVYACIVDQRRAATDITAQFLRSADYRRFVQNWQKYLDAPPPRRPSLDNAMKPVKAMADARTWKAYKRVLAEGRAIDDGSPAEALHNLRKRCKTLRYLIEFFASLYPKGKIQRVLAVLKNLQDNLGEYQDFHVHGELLVKTRGILTEHGHLSPESDVAIARVTQVLVRRGAKSRDGFRKCFGAFSGEEHQHLFRRLFKP